VAINVLKMKIFLNTNIIDFCYTCVDFDRDRICFKGCSSYEDIRNWGLDEVAVNEEGARAGSHLYLPSWRNVLDRVITVQTVAHVVNKIIRFGSAEKFISPI
jgi:hypothetical protein